MTDGVNSASPPAPAPVIFLDTNAVHHATVVLAFATKNGIDLASGELAEIQTALKAARVSAPEWHLNGARIIKYLTLRTQESAVFYYSPITGLELLCNGLKAEAMKKAAAVGGPYRWFSRTSEKDIRDFLEPDGYTRVAAAQANIGALFDDVGITLSEKAIDADVWDVARVFMENVFVAVEDCLVYASAFDEQASELITFDDFLRKTICYSRNPDAAPDEMEHRFAAVKSAIVAMYATDSGWDPANVRLPVHMGRREIDTALAGASRD